jgi:arsenate reductase
MSADDSANPRYSVRYVEGVEPIICFSKLIADDTNPQSEFAAVMCCSQADELCPRINGADVRIRMNYEDPKVADDTPCEVDVYDERGRQICREMLFVVSRLKSVMGLVPTGLETGSHREP